MDLNDLFIASFFYADKLRPPKSWFLTLTMSGVKGFWFESYVNNNGRQLHYRLTTNHTTHNISHLNPGFYTYNMPSCHSHQQQYQHESKPQTPFAFLEIIFSISDHNAPILDTQLPDRATRLLQSLTIGIPTAG